MTIQKLKQYRFYKSRLRTITEEMQNISNGDQFDVLLIERDLLSGIVDEIISFVAAIDDPIVKTAIAIKYINGSKCRSWQYVAAVIGGGNTEDSIRMSVKRYLDKH